MAGITNKRRGLSLAQVLSLIAITTPAAHAADHHAGGADEVAGELLGVVASPVNYAQLANTVGGHLGGIDSALGGIATPTGVLRVDKSGNFYTSIKTAVEAATAGQAVQVYPGAYTEAPFTMPDNVSCKAVGGRESVAITASDAANHLVTMGSSGLFEDFQVTGVTTGGKAAIHFPAGVDQSSANNIEVSGCAMGVFVEATAKDNYCRGIAYVSGSGTLLGKVATGAHMTFEHCTLSAAVTLTQAAFVVDGAGAVAHVNGGHLDGDNAVAGLQVLNGGLIRAKSVHLHSFTNGVHWSTGSGTIHLKGCDLSSQTYDIKGDNGAGDVLYIASTDVDRSKLYMVAGFGSYGIALNRFAGDEGTQGFGDAAFGTHLTPAELVVGGGNSHTNGMVVLTTNGSTSATLDGGNLTDVSAAAASVSGSTFAFQAKTVGHSILVCVNEAGTSLTHFGWKMLQDSTAMTADGVVEFELWNGAAWFVVKVQASDADDFTRYANKVFTRASNHEHLRFGIDSGTTWATKTINSVTGYWLRVRITTEPTTAPIFQQLKVSPSRTEINASGNITAHGLGMWKETLVAAGNMFSSSGATSGAVAIGSGGLPTGWTHEMEVSKLNSNGDNVSFHIALPRGICTAFPIGVRVYGQYQTANPAANESMILSALPIEVAGNLVADPAGGLSAVPRTEVNTDAVTAIPAIATTFTPTVTTGQTKVGLTDIGIYEVDSYYEGDIMAFRFEMDDDGTNNIDFVIWMVEITGVKWTLGEKI